MTKQTPLGLGIVGCGNISQAYFNGSQAFDVMKVVACADLNMDAAQAQADKNNCRAQSVDELLANPEVDMVINLTIAKAHAEVSLAALAAGKHIYSEKPIATKLEDAKALLDAAEAKSLRVGCAPDTFLGGGIQTCRKIVDDGWIGSVTGGTAYMLAAGPESWHPNPAIFYQEGSGPLYDMSPYYLTALVNLIGPIRRVTALTKQTHAQRLATCEARFGELFDVEVPTYYAGVLEFQSGAIVSMSMSFDVHQHGHSPIELYGTHGSLKVPDPNTFGGPVVMWTPISKEWREQAFCSPYLENYRSIGAADMAWSILNESPDLHRASGQLAYHVLEVMEAFEESAESGQFITIASQPERPRPFPLGLVEGRLDVL